MDWAQEYSVSKMIPLITKYDMKQIIKGTTMLADQMEPKMIVKGRTRQGEACYEIQWEKIDGDVYTIEDFYVTFEEREMFKSAFPSLVLEYEEGKLQPKKAPKNKTKKGEVTKPDVCKDDIGTIEDIFGKMKIKENEASNDQDSEKRLKGLEDQSTKRRHRRSRSLCQVKSSDRRPNKLENDNKDEGGKLLDGIAEDGFISLKERLKLMSQRNDVQIDVNKKSSGLHSMGEVEKTPRSKNPWGVERLSRRDSMKEDHIYGNFEIDTSILNFSMSMCQTPATFHAHKTSLPSTKKDSTTFKIDSIDESTLPLRERLRLKMRRS